MTVPPAHPARAPVPVPPSGAPGPGAPAGAPRAVVFAAHGTRDPAGVAVAHRLASALGARLPHRPVRLAFVDVAGPGLAEVVDAVAGPVTVIPAFLGAGYHVREDVPAQIAATGRTDVTITAPLGAHPLVVRALWDRLRAAGWRPGDAVALAAAGSSDPRATADTLAAATRLSRLVGGTVPAGFIATGSPRAGDLVAALRAEGAGRVVVASWLLAPGLFHRTLSGCGADAVAAPLGVHPAVVDRLACLAAAGSRPPMPRHRPGLLTRPAGGQRRTAGWIEPVRPAVTF